MVGHLAVLLHQRPSSLMGMENQTSLERLQVDDIIIAEFLAEQKAQQNDSSTVSLEYQILNSEAGRKAREKIYR